MGRFVKSTADVIYTDSFRGLDVSGEEKKSFSSPVYMKNFRITEKRILEKRCGYKVTASGLGCDSCWAGSVGGVYVFVYKKGAEVCAVSVSDGAEIASQTAGAGEAGFVLFGGKLYIIGKDTFLCFDGASFHTVEPYIPTVSITTAPNGGGKIHESLNLLCDKAKISYSPTGTDTVYTLPDICESIVTVEADGQIMGGGYVYSSQNKTVTFSSAPAQGVDSLVVTFSLSGGAIPEKDIPGPEFCVYGGDSDTRVFAYGKDNVLRYSDVTAKGADISYFPSDNFVTVGDGTYKVTALVRHFDRLIVFTERETWYLYRSSVSYDGYSKPSFPVYPLNSAVGCIGGGAAFTDNFPVTLSADGIYRFGRTTLRDERNATRISDRVSAYLTPEFLHGAAVFDNEHDKEMWCACGGTVLIYNYGVDEFYVYDGIDAKMMFEYNGNVGFFDGENLCVFERALTEDDGKPFCAVYESGFVFFGKTKKKRRLKRVCVMLLPEKSTSVILTAIPNRGGAKSYGLNGEFRRVRFSFDCIDFSDFTFECEARPDPVELRTDLSSFEALKIRIENSRSEPASVTGMALTVD